MGYRKCSRAEKEIIKEIKGKDTEKFNNYYFNNYFNN